MKFYEIFSLTIFIAIIRSENTPKSVQVEIPVKPFNHNSKLIGRGSRIYGGKTAQDGNFPFVNEINHFVAESKYVMCTGAFITPSWTITAYHCVKRRDPNWNILYVRYGTASRSSLNRKTLGVNSLVWWPDNSTWLDLVLLHTREPVQLTSNVGLLQLPPLSMENSYFEGYLAIQAGFGAFRDLQYHKIKMQTFNSGCPWTDGFYHWNLCALTVANGSGTEGGDSGSPVFYYDSNEPTLIGVYWGGNRNWQLAIRASSFLRSIAENVGVTLRP